MATLRGNPTALRLLRTGGGRGAQMPACDFVERDGHQGVKIAGYGGRDCELLFAAAGPASGRVEVKQGARVLVSRAFATEVREEFEPIEKLAEP